MIAAILESLFPPGLPKREEEPTTSPDVAEDATVARVAATIVAVQLAIVRKRPAAYDMSYTFPVKPAPALPKDTIRFFRDLVRNNNKPWMDENRERYRTVVVEPLRSLLERLTPIALKLNPRFVTSGRVGDNFSRINRDIRFARDKTPYRPHMYLFFEEGETEGGQLYTGVSADAVTCGFRVYGGERTSSLVQFGRVRGRDNSLWIERQKRRFGKKYDSYWYSTEKGEWTKHNGWPTEPDQWKKLQAWIVRRKFPAAAATRAGFDREVAKIFGDVYRFYEFTSSPHWKR